MHGNGPTEPQLQVVITGATSHGEKKKWGEKKGKKKEEVPSTGIELGNFDFIVLWFDPLRHSGINWEIVSYGEVYGRDARFAAGLESSFSSFGETSLVVLTHRCQMLNGGEAAEGA